MDGLRGTMAGTITGDVPGKFWHDMFYDRLVNLIAGPSGAGKSIVTAKLVADVTRMGKNVIYCPEEDSLMLSYRLRAAGADLDKVRIAQFVIPGDLRDLEHTIIHDAAKLVVLDTAAKHISGPQMRWDKPLAELDELLNDVKCAGLIIHHTNKNVPKTANWRAAIGGATGGLVGTSRAIHLVGPRPDDAAQVVLCPVKDNYRETPKAIAFEFATEEFDQTVGDAVEVSYVTIAEKDLVIGNPTALVCIKGDEQSKGPNAEKLAEAAEFITLALANGPAAVGDTNVCPAGCGSFHIDIDGCPDCGGNTVSKLGLKTQAEDAEVSWGTVKRAKAAIEVESSRKMSDHHNGGKCSIPYWRLPDGHPALVPNAPTDLH